MGEPAQVGRLAKIWQTLIVWYAISLAPASVYFTWEYAHRNSFFWTVLIGAPEAPFKAVVWPGILALRLLERAEPDVPHLRRSCELLVAAAARDNTAGPSPEAIKLLRGALDEARSERDSAMRAVNAELPEVVRTSWIPSIEATIQMAETGVIPEGFTDRINRWNRWTTDHPEVLRRLSPR